MFRRIGKGVKFIGLGHFEDTKSPIILAALGGVCVSVIGVLVPPTMFWAEFEIGSIAEPGKDLPHIWPQVNSQNHAHVTCRDAHMASRGASRGTPNIAPPIASGVHPGGENDKPFVSTERTDVFQSLCGVLFFRGTFADPVCSRGRQSCFLFVANE